jgi:hypothetical protein
MIAENLTGNLFGFYGIIVSGPVMIFLLLGISSLKDWVVNWFVNVRSCETMRNDGGWSWRKCLGWILADRKAGIWSWFSLLFGLLYLSGCRCVLRLLISNGTLDFHGLN